MEGQLGGRGDDGETGLKCTNNNVTTCISNKINVGGQLGGQGDDGGTSLKCIILSDI